MTACEIHHDRRYLPAQRSQHIDGKQFQTEDRIDPVEVDAVGHVAAQRRRVVLIAQQQMDMAFGLNRAFEHPPVGIANERPAQQILRVRVEKQPRRPGGPRQPVAHVGPRSVLANDQPLRFENSQGFSHRYPRPFVLTRQCRLTGQLSAGLILGENLSSQTIRQFPGHRSATEVLLLVVSHPPLLLTGDWLACPSVDMRDCPRSG